MKTWKLVLVGAVLTAMVYMPVAPDVRQATQPANRQVAMAELKLEKLSLTPPQQSLSRSPVSAFATSQKPLDGIRIAIDPGHGGQTKWDKIYYCGGTVGVATKQTESDVNLRVSLCLRQYLEAAGAEVIMTRIEDDRCTNGGTKSEELDYRSNLANARKADLFISVHHNEGTNRDTNYTAVFYPSGTANSISLAENISSSVSRYLGTQNIGAKAGSYRVLSGIKMPGVIVEASFMSHAPEDARLQSLSYNKMEAKAIATGIMNYIRITKGRQVDFNTIFRPIDDQAHTAQMLADATFVRKQIVEKRSLFGVRYEEVTYDASGNVTGVRPVGNGSLVAKAKSAKDSAKKAVSSTAKAAKKTTAKVTSSKSSKSSSKKSVKVADSKTTKKPAASTTKAKKIKVN